MLLLGLSIGVRSWSLSRVGAVTVTQEPLTNVPTTEVPTTAVPTTTVPAAEIPAAPIPAATEVLMITKVKISTLRPTQLAVGVQQVNEKAARIRAKTERKQNKYLKGHPVPVIIGPGGEYYLVDHHHLCRAAQLLGMDSVFITVMRDGDWSQLAPEEFWKKMHASNYVWLHDAAGNPLTLAEFTKVLPKDVSGLKDDPHRSIAAIVRKAGGFDKDWMPFAEFHWANFFRVHVPLKAPPKISDEDIAAAMQFSRVPDASHLPGYIK